MRAKRTKDFLTAHGKLCFRRTISAVSTKWLRVKLAKYLASSERIVRNHFMTLGQLIQALESVDQTAKIPLGIGNPHSWRGNYAELAFEPVENTTIAAMLKAARSAVGATYQGHKGCDFTMGLDTRIHVDLDGHWSDGDQIWGMIVTLWKISIQDLHRY